MKHRRAFVLFAMWGGFAEEAAAEEAARFVSFTSQCLYRCFMRFRVAIERTLFQASRKVQGHERGRVS